MSANIRVSSLAVTMLAGLVTISPAAANTPESERVSALFSMRSRRRFS